MRSNQSISIYIVLFCICWPLISCGQEGKISRNTTFFKDTRAFELAKAVEKGNVEKIEKLVKEDSTLMEITNPISGSNALVLAIYIEQYESFKKLLDLGANPDFINPYTKYSALIYAIRPFGTANEWRKDHRYAKLLLEYGADPNYAVTEDFTNEKGHHVSATSPLMKASGFDLNTVKMLIEDYGADYTKRVGGEIPLAEAFEASKFNIIYYYIDTLNVNVHHPLDIQNNNDFYIPDYIKLYMGYKKGTEGYGKKKELIEHLKRKGINFEDYEYKL